MKENYRIKVNSAIALCHVLDEFEQFEENLKLFIPQASHDFLIKLFNISKGQKYLGSGKTKKFYNENKEIIDKINEYSNITEFIGGIYTSDVCTGSLDFLYGYLLVNRENIDKIISTLEKLKQTGIDNIEFNDDLHFGREQYNLNKFFYDNTHFVYLDNIKIIPNYDSSSVIYENNNSNYMLNLLRESRKIRSVNNTIILNDLTIDPNLLPNEISKGETFDMIIKKALEKEYECSVIRDSVDLSVGINELNYFINDFSEKISNLESVNEKEELLELLKNMKESIIEMEKISDKHEEFVLSKSFDISKELLEDEKKKYIKKRIYNKKQSSLQKNYNL